MANPNTIVPEFEPESVIQGDTLLFQVNDFEHPSSAWSMEYLFSGSITTTAAGTVADDGGFLFQIDTSNWTPGTYWYQGKVTSSDTPPVILTIRTGSFSVLAAFSSTNIAPYDGRSMAKKTLDAIDSLMLGKPNNDAQEIEVGGKRLIKMDPDKLIRLRDYYLKQVGKERRAERISKGETAGLARVTFK